VTVVDLVRGFEQRWGAKVVEDQQKFSLTFKGGISCRVFALQEPRFIVEGVVSTISADEWQAKTDLQQLLQVSLSQFHNSKETLAFDESTEQIVIFRSGNAEEISEADFDALIERFVNRLEYWQRIAKPATSNYSFGLSP